MGKTFCSDFSGNSHLYLLHSHHRCQERSRPHFLLVLLSVSLHFQGAGFCLDQVKLQLPVCHKFYAINHHIIL